MKTILKKLTIINCRVIWIFVRDCYGKCPRKLNFNSWKDWNLGKTQENDNHFKIFFRRLSIVRTRLKIVAIISRHFRAWKALEDTIGRFCRKWPYGVGTDVHGDFLFVHVTSIFLIFNFLVSRPISLRCDTSLFLLLSKKAHKQNNRPNGSKHS